jgi:large subunit ribosomal protein L24e
VDIPQGTGKMYVKKDAKIYWFCSRRCEKNMLVLKRNPRYQAYTAAARKDKQQQMAALAHAKEHDKEQESAAAPEPKVKAVKKAKNAPAKKPAKPAEAAE